MPNGLSIALLIIGVILLVWGFSALDSFDSDVSRFFTGSPTDKAIWLMIGGVAATIIGGVGLLRRVKKL